MPDPPAVDLPEPSKPRPWPRLTIGRLMVAIAVAAGLAAIARVPILGELMAQMVPAFGLTGLAFAWPLWLARPGRRLRLAARIAALWPLTIPASLHAAWGIARLSLGHPPGPADHGFVIGLLEASIFSFMLGSLISSFAFPVLATLGPMRSVDDPGVNFVLMGLAWAAVVLIWRWDPVQAAWWFID